MKWNKHEGYVKYTSSLENLKSMLGISQIDHYIQRPELSPYDTYIFEYLARRIICLGEVGLKERVSEVFNVFEEGADKIISGATLDLAWELGISTGKIYVPEEEIEFNKDRFIFSWSNVLTALCVRLKFQYSSLFVSQVPSECCQCGSPGQTTADYESWSSGVYPEDEEFDRVVYNKNHTAWGVNNKDSWCNCYRKYDGETN